MYKPDRKSLVKTFTELAEIPSPSWHEKEVMNYIIKRFRNLGGKIEKYPCGTSHNLLIKMNGSIKCPPVMFSGHMDTVGPCSSVVAVEGKTRITSDGTSVLGSDDKAAITMFIEAFEYAKKGGIKHGPVEILLSCAEEVGLQGIKGFDLSAVKSGLAFVFDSSGSIGSIVTEAPYHSNMTISVKGKASHAGMEPEKGVNAIIVLAEILCSIPSGRVDDETSINTGIISGGRATNIVADESKCEIEIRSIEKKKMLELEQKVKKTARDVCASRNARLKIDRTLEYAGFRIPENSRICRITSRAMERIKITPRFTSMGGGSDTNIINNSGIRAVNLSCGMQKIHSTDEFVLIKDLEKGTSLVLSIMETVCSENR